MKTLKHLFFLVTVTIRRAIAVLDLPADIDDLIIAANRIRESMLASPYFGTLAAKLAALGLKITTLTNTHVAVHTTPPSKTAAERNVALDSVNNDLRMLRNDVQNISDSAPPADGETIVTSAGMKVKKLGEINKQDFVVKHSELSGSVDLIAKGAESNRSAHEWQMSLDGSVWTYITTTLQAHTTVTNLTPATKMLFRHRTITKDGPEEWSQEEQIIVN